jgi:hypothetical protein
VPRIEEHIDIEARQADVFRFCHNTANRPEWDEQVMHVDMLTPAPIRSGTLLRVDGKTRGSVFSWDGEYVHYQFPQGSKLRVIDTAFASPFAPGSEITWEFSSVSAGTRFSWVWNYRSRGIIARVLDSLGGRASANRAIKNSLNNLKDIIESGRRIG